MLSRKEVEIYGPAGFHPAQKEKDYVHHWILSFFSREGFGAVFKGGTCLQKAFSLPRYSEDLDFTLNDSDLVNLDSISAFLSSAGFLGLEWKVKETSISTTARLKYQGPLYSGSSLSEGFVTLEFSKREKTIQKPIVQLINSPYPDILAYSLRIMDPREILAEKVRAIITRDSARDLFDAYFLLHKQISFKKELINAKLKYYDLDFSLKDFEKHVHKLNKIYPKEMKALASDFLDYKIVCKAVLQKANEQLCE